MTKKEFIEQASKTASLQYDLWRKFPNYVHMDLTLSTDRDGKEGIKYNIYTPELCHNNYSDFRDFIYFMECVIKDGVINIRVKLLKAKLNKAKVSKADAIDTICEAQKELDKLN